MPYNVTSIEYMLDERLPLTLGTCQPSAFEVQGQAVGEPDCNGIDL